MHVVTAQQLILQAWQLKPFQQVSVIYVSVIYIQINHKYLLWQSQTRGATYTWVNHKYLLWQSQTRGATYTRVYTVWPKRLFFKMLWPKLENVSTMVFY